MQKLRKIKVQSFEIAIIVKENQDYISLTDMIRAKDGDFFISDWLRNRNTVEFLGIWESINNPNFNYGEFATIKTQVGLNNYKISVKEWVQKTNAIGLKATVGRYGGTFAHKDIAFEFGMWISPQFKLYLIKEFQRLKLEENERLVLGWDVKRQLTKINYRIHIDSIKENIVLPRKLSTKDATILYANEADVLNVALFGKTAKNWRDKNKGKDGNIRDYCDVTQLVVLANLEGINAELIRQKLSQPARLVKLNEIAISQMKALLDSPSVKRLEAGIKSEIKNLK
ncbi:KilA-N domain-containing protein [Candidatus Parcubacteria bacterium]|nr:KilA-N domain-containing protein [Candidatus Parcubacteria bacterium]